MVLDRPRILLTGASGRVGSAVAQALSRRGAAYSVMLRAPEKAQALPGAPKMLKGDLLDGESCRAALTEADAALLITPVGPDETEAGRTFLDAAEATGSPRIVYISIMRLRKMRAIPHFEAKVPIADRVLADDRNTVLEPNFFFQNDNFYLPALAQGLYPLPLGKVGVNSVDVRDIAEAAAAALLTERDLPGPWPLCGPDVVTEQSAADRYAEHLGRPIATLKGDINVWINATKQALPIDEWFENDLRKMMEVTQEQGCLATQDDIKRAERAVGRPLRRYDDFVAEIAATTLSAQAEGGPTAS